MKYSRIIVVGKGIREPLDDIEIDEDMLKSVSAKSVNMKFGGRYVYIAERTEGKLKGKALYLDAMYDWILGKDNLGGVCLVPLMKQE